MNRRLVLMGFIVGAFWLIVSLLGDISMRFITRIKPTQPSTWGWFIPLFIVITFSGLFYLWMQGRVGEGGGVE